MADRLETTWRRIQSLFGAPPPGPAVDATLLARFADGRDEAAFAELVRRHGPLVRGVCRRVLPNSHDAEDAAQATFLILAHKAASIRRRDSLPCWLHGVALRVAVRLRQRARGRKEQPLSPAVEPARADPDEVSWREVRGLVDEELARLPEPLRRPLILCYIEGRTRDEAARELGWSLSTFRGRLERGRERLRRRLELRGVVLSAALLATLALSKSEAAIPVTTSVSSTAAAVAAEVMRAMFLSRIKAAAVWCLVILGLGAGAAATAYQWGRAQAAAPPPEVAEPPAPPKAPEAQKPEKEDPIFTIKKVEDLDAITAETSDGKERRIVLDGVLPFTVWPRDLTDDQKKLRDEGLKLARKWLEGHKAEFVPTKPADRGHLRRYTFGPTKTEQRWTGEAPAEQLARNGFDMGVLLVQEGYSPCVSRAVWDEKTLVAYSRARDEAITKSKGIHNHDAESLAKSRGLYSGDFFDQRLQLIAHARMDVEKEWGLGPIREWRKIASRVHHDERGRPALTHLYLSPDGKSVMLGAGLGWAELLDAFTLKPTREIYGDGAHRRALGFTSDNQPWLLRVDTDDKGQEGTTYHLANAATDEERCSFEMPRHVRLAALSPDGNTLAVTDPASPARVALWDARTGKKLGDLGEHKNAVERLTFSANGQALATGSAHTANADLTVKEPGEIKVWQVASRKEKAARRIPGACAALQFTADGKRLFAGVNRPVKGIGHVHEGSVVWLDAADLSEKGEVHRASEFSQRFVRSSWVVSFAVSPDDKMLVVDWWEHDDDKVSDKPVISFPHLRVYDVSSRKEIAAPEAGPAVGILTFSRDGNFLLTGGDQLNLSLWELLRR